MGKVIIYGFGRMGLTHYAILNHLFENSEFLFVDLNKKVNFFAKRNLNVEITNNDKVLNDSFEYGMVCTPPMFHIPILNKMLAQGIPNIFIEKPFGGIEDDFSNLQHVKEQVSVGYVLRFNPIVQWVKDFIEVQDVVKVQASYFSNTIEKKPKGWRNGSFSGVTNEMGSHIIDLCVYLFDLSNPIIISKQIDSVVSDIDDVLKADLIDGSISYNFHFDWVNKSFRKPVFNFIITMKNGSVLKFDQQKCELYSGNQLLKKISSVDISQKVPFYIRGIDFTAQMQDFIGQKKIIATSIEAIRTRNIVKRLITK